MDKLIITGAQKLKGNIKVSGAKNAAMKVLLTGILTDKPLFIENVPLISSVFGTADILAHIGVKTKINNDHTMKIVGDAIKNAPIPLECGGLYRTATMAIGPLLARFGQAVVPNPGGCRLGKRPIERHIEGLQALGAKITYKDGFFFATSKKLKGTKYQFSHNSHTGTETLILAAVLAEGETILENASAEPEVDDLIELLTRMGAKIKRLQERMIVISGVKKLQGAEFNIMPDRNEVVTFAIGALATGGDVTIVGAQRLQLTSFLEKLDKVGASWNEEKKDTIRFYIKKPLRSANVETMPHPGFMTDWQAPWAILMTQAKGTSIVHETIYEDRFGYVSELLKMGADIHFFHPYVENPQAYYNFNWADRLKHQFQAIKIHGKTSLHNAVMEISDLRAGATLVLGAIIASGESVLYGVEHIDRGYEQLEERLNKLGAKIKRIKNKEIL